MSVKDLIAEYGKNISSAELKMILRDDLVYNVTEDLLVEMERQDVNKVQLAKLLGKTRSYITQILSGKRNMTLGSLSDICFHLNIEPKLSIIKENQDKDSMMEKITVTGDCSVKWVRSDQDNVVTNAPKNNYSDLNVIFKTKPSFWENAA